MTQTGPNFMIKSTLSLKMRNETGDEVFISTGAEAHHVSEDDISEKKSTINTLLDEWLTERAESIGQAAFGGYVEDDDTGGEYDEEDEDESEEDEDEDEDEDDEDEDEGEELTEADIAKMKKAELDALIEEYELDIDPKTKIAEKREAIIEALFSEEDEDEDDEDEDESDEDEDEEEFEPYEEDELSEMKLKELNEIATEWGLTIKYKKNADLKAKKATVIKAILDFQEENADE